MPDVPPVTMMTCPSIDIGGLLCSQEDEVQIRRRGVFTRRAVRYQLRQIRPSSKSITSFRPRRKSHVQCVHLFCRLPDESISWSNPHQTEKLYPRIIRRGSAKVSVLVVRLAGDNQSPHLLVLDVQKKLLAIVRCGPFAGYGKNLDGAREAALCVRGELQENRFLLNVLVHGNHLSRHGFAAEPYQHFNRRAFAALGAYVGFYSGYSDDGDRDDRQSVRLVRSGQ